MKLFKSSVFCGITIFFLVINQCRSTLLAGTMFYYLVGSYLTREVVPNVLSSVLKTLPSNIAANRNSSNASGTSTLNTMIEIAQALGLDRRMDNYMKEAWPEFDCSLKPCNGNKKRTQKKMSEEEMDSDENDENYLSKPELTASEEIEGFEIFGDNEDVQFLANEELADIDPLNFYHSMKDQNTKRKQMEDNDYYSNYGRDSMPPKPDNFNRNKYILPPRKLPRDLSLMPKPIIPMPRRGLLPLFKRYNRTPRHRMQQLNPNLQGPSMYPKKNLIPLLENKNKPSSMFDSLYKIMNNILSTRNLASEINRIKSQN